MPDERDEALEAAQEVTDRISLEIQARVAAAEVFMLSDIGNAVWQFSRAYARAEVVRELRNMARKIGEYDDPLSYLQTATAVIRARANEIDNPPGQEKERALGHE